MTLLLATRVTIRTIAARPCAASSAASAAKIADSELSAGAEEGPEKFGRLVGQRSSRDFDAMVQAVAVEEP